MCNSENLRIVAAQLKTKETFFTKHNILCLQAFIRDGGKCRYCEQPLFENYDTVSATDHLLPRSRYPDLEWDPLNLVASCGECNHIKSNWSPTDEKVVELTEQDREHLIKAVKRYVEDKKKAPDFRALFPKAKDRFFDAVAEHRKLCPDCSKRN